MSLPTRQQVRNCTDSDSSPFSAPISLKAHYLLSDPVSHSVVQRQDKDLEAIIRIMSSAHGCSPALSEGFAMNRLTAPPGGRGSADDKVEPWIALFQVDPWPYHHLEGHYHALLHGICAHTGHVIQTHIDI